MPDATKDSIPGARGATVGDVPIHSVRSHGYMLLIKRLSLVIQVKHFQFDMTQLIEQASCQEFYLEYVK
jgi:hypothetical protein